MQTLEVDIVFPGCSSSPTAAVTTPSDNGGSAVCALCLSAPGKYTCPRCNAPYCSLPCYRGARHSACSELFYKESVLHALREQGAEGRREMEEMLLKLREREEPEEELEEGEGRLWDSLSRQEKEHFKELLRSGHIGSLVPQWTPWWEASAGSKVIPLPEADPELCHSAPLPACGHDNGTEPQTCTVGTNSQTSQEVPEPTLRLPETTDEGQKIHEKKDTIEIPSEETVKPANRGDCTDISLDIRLQRGPRIDEKSDVLAVPPLLRTIPPLCSLTRNPSPLVRFALVNVIYGYSFSLVRYNGDLNDEEDMLDFIGTLLSVSGALSTTAVYNSTAQALKSAVRAATDPSLGGDEGVAMLAMEATAKILLGDDGKRYSLAALSHLYRLLGNIRKVTEEKDAKKGAFNARKKCLFLAAWVNEHEDGLAVLSAEVLREYRRHLRDHNEVAEISQGLQRAWGGKRPPPKKNLIEELD